MRAAVRWVALTVESEIPYTAIVVNTPEATTQELAAGSYALWVSGTGIGGGPIELAPCRWTVTIEPN